MEVIRAMTSCVAFDLVAESKLDWFDPKHEKLLLLTLRFAKIKILANPRPKYFILSKVL